MLQIFYQPGNFGIWGGIAPLSPTVTRLVSTVFWL